MTTRLASNLALLIALYLRRHSLTPIEALGVLRLAADLVANKLAVREKV